MESQREPKVDVESPEKGPDFSQDDASSGMPVIDEKKERKLIWKMDLHILPFVVLLYLFSFLDRGMSDFTAISMLLCTLRQSCELMRLIVNIGNGKLYGLEEDLGLEGNQYQTAVSILFVTYCVSQHTLLINGAYSIEECPDRSFRYSRCHRI